MSVPACVNYNINRRSAAAEGRLHLLCTQTRGNPETMSDQAVGCRQGVIVFLDKKKITSFLMRSSDDSPDVECQLSASAICHYQPTRRSVQPKYVAKTARGHTGWLEYQRDKTVPGKGYTYRSKPPVFLLPPTGTDCLPIPATTVPPDWLWSIFSGGYQHMGTEITLGNTHLHKKGVVKGDGGYQTKR